MSDLSLFLRKNKKVKENTFYAATKSLCDADGKALMWELRAIPTKEDERIRDACTIEVPITGKPNMFRHKVKTNDYIAKMIVASVVYPDLLDAELQDSYGVKTPEALLKELVDDPGEYAEFMAYVQQFNGFNVSMQDEVDEAKN